MLPTTSRSTAQPPDYLSGVVCGRSRPRASVSSRRLLSAPRLSRCALHIIHDRRRLTDFMNEHKSLGERNVTIVQRQVHEAPSLLQSPRQLMLLS